jgi:drug/metabolite transporter (DMT)-like permease
LYTSGTRKDLSVAQTVRSGQIITAAMVFGMLAFLAVVLVVNRPDQATAETTVRTPLLTYTAAAFALLTLLVLAVIVSRIDPFIRRKLASQAAADDLQRLAQALLTRSIVILAMLEGAALFNLVAYFLERGVLSLAAAGLLMLIMAAQFPSADRATRWIERQRKLLEQA